MKSRNYIQILNHSLEMIERLKLKFADEVCIKLILFTNRIFLFLQTLKLSEKIIGPIAQLVRAPDS